MSEMPFCGREAELQMLVDHWRLAADLELPKPQVVTIQAEPGVGKTRLAMEFYRWLSTNVDRAAAGGYWPDGLATIGRNLDINPSLSELRCDIPIPYLWWGIRAGAPDVQNSVVGDAVASYDRYVTPQLVPLLVNARVRKSRVSLARIWAEVGVDVAANLAQVDSVLSVGRALFETIRIIRKDTPFSATERAMLEQGQPPAASRADALLDDLARVLAPGSRDYSRTPAVILIDDAQFAHHDAALVGFCDKLITRAFAESWPVLVLVTHWRREFELLRDKEPGSFSAMLARTRRLPAESGDSSGSYRELVLRPVGDLSAALAQHLPGLREDQRQQILERSAGNPRFLEQIIALTEGRISYFELRDRGRALTDKGLRRLLDTAVTIEETIFSRLMETVDDVKEALACASTQGMRFGSALSEALAVRLLGQSRLAGLAKAKSPYNVVDDYDGAAVAEFTDRLFYQASLRLREELERIPGGADDLDDALRAILRERLTGASNAERLSEAEEMLALEAATRILADTDDGDDQRLRTIALVKLIQVTCFRGRTESMALWTSELAMHWQQCPESVDPYWLGQLYLLKDQFPRLPSDDLDQLAAAAAGYADSGDANEHPVDRDLARAIALDLAAVGMRRRGQEGADALEDESYALLTQAISADSPFEMRIFLFKSIAARATRASLQLDLATSLEHTRRLVELARHEHSTRDRFDSAILLISAIHMLCRLELAIEPNEEHRRLLAHARALLEEPRFGLAELIPDVQFTQRRLEVDLLAAESDDEAIAGVSALAEEAAELERANPRFLAQNHFASCLLKLGQMQLLAGRYEECIATLTRCLERVDSSATLQGTGADDMWEAVIYRCLGSAHYQLESYDAAAAALRSGIIRWRANGSTQTAIDDGMCELARSLWELGAYDEALEYYLELVERGRPDEASSFESSVAAGDFAGVAFEAGETARADGRYELAAGLFSEAVTAKRVEVSGNRTFEALDELTDLLTHVGLFAAEIGDAEAANAMLDENKALAREMLELAPGPETRWLQGVVERVLAHKCEHLNDFRSALRHHEASFDSALAYVAERGDEAALVELALCYAYGAACARKAGLADAAQRHLVACREVAEGLSDDQKAAVFSLLCDFGVIGPVGSGQDGVAIH